MGGCRACVRCAKCRIFRSRTVCQYTWTGRKRLPLWPSSTHWFGTDHLGRDMLAQTLRALSASLQVGLAVSLLASVLSTSAGLLSGYFSARVELNGKRHRWIDDAFVSVAEAVVSVPSSGRCCADSAAVGDPRRSHRSARPNDVGFAISAVRAEIRRLAGTAFVDAAVSTGASHARILRVHLAPHVRALVAGLMPLTFAHAVLAESTLSLFGCRCGPSVRDLLGAQIRDAQESFLVAPHLLWSPVLVLLAMTLALTGLVSTGRPRTTGSIRYRLGMLAPVFVLGFVFHNAAHSSAHGRRR